MGGVRPPEQNPFSGRAPAYGLQIITVLEDVDLLAGYAFESLKNKLEIGCLEGDRGVGSIRRD